MIHIKKIPKKGQTRTIRQEWGKIKTDTHTARLIHPVKNKPIVIDVVKLWGLSKSLDLTHVKTAELVHFNFKANNNSPTMTIYDFVDHIKRLKRCRVGNYPILILDFNNGWYNILDGIHRVAWHYFTGSIKVICRVVPLEMMERCIINQ